MANQLNLDGTNPALLDGQNEQYLDGIPPNNGARVTQEFAEVLRSDVDIGKARVSQDFAEVLRSDADIAKARLTEAFAEVLRSQNDIAKLRFSQDFAEVLRSDDDYSPPPDATARTTQVYAEVLTMSGALVTRTKKRRVITAMAGF